MSTDFSTDCTTTIGENDGACGAACERFHAVVYDGIDPITHKERRSWHAAGIDRADADAMVERLEEEHRLLRDTETATRGLTFGRYLTNSWLPAKKLELRATTYSRYEWMTGNYVATRVGGILLRRLRADHLEQLYTELLALPGRCGTGLSPKTVHNIARHGAVRAADGGAPQAPVGQRGRRCGRTEVSGVDAADAVLDRRSARHVPRCRPDQADVSGLSALRHDRHAPR